MSNSAIPHIKKISDLVKRSFKNNPISFGVDLTNNEMRNTKYRLNFLVIIYFVN